MLQRISGQNWEVAGKWQMLMKGITNSVIPIKSCNYKCLRSNNNIITFCCTDEYFCTKIDGCSFVCCCAVLSHVWLCAAQWTVALQDHLPTEFSRQKYWSRLPFPPSEDLLYLAIKPTSVASPSFAGKYFLPLVLPNQAKDLLRNNCDFVYVLAL